MAASLSSDGLVAPRAADFRTSITSRINSELVDRGLPPVDFDDDLIFTLLRNVLASELDSVGQALQAVYDARVRDNATGIHLDDMGALIGVARNEATYSTATVTLTGTAGTVVPAGKLVEGGGVDGNNRWRITSDATIGGGGTVDVTVESETIGAVTASAATITTIVTPVSGWTAVTNAAAATTGRDREGDAAYRVRQRRSAQRRGAGSPNALRGALLDLDFVTAANVLTNPSTTTATVSGVSMAASSVSVIVDPSTLTTAQEQSLAEVIYKYAIPGIYMNGAETATVTRADGVSETVRWTYASDLSVTIAVTVVLDNGYVLADVQAPIQSLVATYFTQNSEPGVIITDSDIERQIMTDIAGVRRVEVTLNGGTTITANADQKPVVNGTPSVST